MSVTTAREPSLASLSTFFETYAAALGSGDPVRIAACFELPAMVLRRDGASVTVQRHQIVEAFAALVRQEPRHWTRQVVPELRCVEVLDAGLLRVDVEWHAGPPGEPERYIYLLRTVRGRPRIHVAVGPLPATSRTASGGESR